MQKKKKESLDFAREMPKIAVEGQARMNLETNLFYFYPMHYYKSTSKHQLKYAKYKSE